MLKDINEQLQEIGLKPVIGGLLIFVGFILIADIAGLSSLFEFKNLDPKKIVAIIFLIIGFIIIYTELTKQKKQLDKAADGKELTYADKETLQIIAGLFERKAYMEAEQHEEDLRAMFSAANETRIEIQKLKNKISFPVLRKLIESMYKDFEEIRKLTPLFITTEIEPFDPDAEGIRPNREKTIKDITYINDVWSKTEEWDDYVIKNKDIGNSGYYPYTAIMVSVKKRMKLLSHMKDIIMRMV